MSERTQIDELLAQVQRLRESVQPEDRDFEFKAMEAEVAKARLAAELAARERDTAVAELIKLKADVQWAMEKLKIKDLMFMQTEPGGVPCAREGWLPLWADPKDSERLDWINKHGRAGISSEHWLISIPHHLTMDEELPDCYNVRHIIDLSRECAGLPRRLEGDTTEGDA